jgi:hypothetical protein
MKGGLAHEYATSGKVALPEIVGFVATASPRRIPNDASMLVDPLRDQIE